MRLVCSALLAALSIAVLPGGCGPVDSTNPFLTLTESVTADGSNVNDNTGTGGGGGGVTVAVFRRDLAITFSNNNTDADADVSFVAWVASGSIRSAEQQDALLADGYVQLTREVRLGSVFTLPPGTFVYNGPGLAGATRVHLRAAGAGANGAADPTTQTFTIITPDVVLAFSQPPVSCDSVAFTYSRDGSVITDDFVEGGVGPFAGSNTTGGYKTFSQVDAYQCDPLRPGMFLKLGGGARQSNEFFEGQSIRFDFNQMPDADGDFAIVIVS